MKKTIEEWIANETEKDRGLLWGASLKDGNELPMAKVKVGSIELSIPQTMATGRLLTCFGSIEDVGKSIVDDICSNYNFNGSRKEEVSFAEKKLLEDGPYKCIGGLMKDSYIANEGWNFDFCLTNAPEAWDACFDKDLGEER